VNDMDEVRLLLGEVKQHIVNRDSDIARLADENARLKLEVSMLEDDSNGQAIELEEIRAAAGLDPWTPHQDVLDRLRTLATCWKATEESRAAYNDIASQMQEAA
jgi:hypothetical protein